MSSTKLDKDSEHTDINDVNGGEINDSSTENDGEIGDHSGEGLRYQDRPSPRDLLQREGIDHSTYTDKSGREMEVRVDSSIKGANYQDADSCQFGLYHEDQRVGHMDMSLNYEPVDWNDANSELRYTNARVHMMEVEPPYRGAGNGEHLLNTAERTAQAYGAERIEGTPLDSKAQSFFEHQESKGTEWEVRDENKIVKELKRS